MDSRISKLVEIFNAQSEKAIKDNGKTWDQLEALNYFHSINDELTTAQILMGFFVFNTNINIEAFQVDLTYDELRIIADNKISLFDDRMIMIINKEIDDVPLSKVLKPLKPIDYSKLTENDLDIGSDYYLDVENFEITNFEPATEDYLILNFYHILNTNRFICYFFDKESNRKSFVVIHYNEYTKEATNIELANDIGDFIDLSLFDDFIDILNEDNIILDVLNNESEGKSKFPKFTYNGETPDEINTVPEAYAFFWYLKFVCKFGDNWHIEDSFPVDENWEPYFSELDTEIYLKFINDAFDITVVEYNKYGYEDVYDLYNSLRDYEPSTINEII